MRMDWKEENRKRAGKRRTGILSVGICALFTVLLCFVLMGSLAVFADTVPVSSDRKFLSEMIGMTGAHDRDVTPEQAARNPYITERLIVKSESRFLDPDDYGAVDAIQSRDGTYLLQFDSSASARRAEKKIAKEEATVFVEPDTLLFADSEDDTGTVYSSEDLDAMVFADSDSDRWNIHQMLLDRYADYILNKGFNREIIVAVLDTGISFSHPLYSSRLLTGDSASFVDGYNSANENDVRSGMISPHGTHIAGIVAQSTPGVNVRILPIRVLSSVNHQGNASSVARAIDYAVAKGAKVINLSLSGASDSGSKALEASIHNAVSNGAVVVSSAGNEGIDISRNYIVPSYIPECLSVGSVNEDKVRADNSNFGSTLDVVAPGMDIWSSVYTPSGNGYGNLSGTSMAAPHVSGEAAMLFMTNSSASAPQIESMIQANAIDLGPSGKDSGYGYGFASLEGFLTRRITYSPGTYGTFAEVTHTVIYGNATPAAPEVTGKTGYTFDGWSPKVSSTVDGDVNYVAQWKKTGKTQGEEDTGKTAGGSGNTKTDGTAGNTQNQSSGPQANVSYQIPMKTKQKTSRLKVVGLTGSDRVVSWVSSNKSRVSVTGKPDGTCVVRAGKKTGNAVITATCSGGKVITFRIKVQKNRVPTKKILIDSTSVTMSVGQSLQLKPQLYPITSSDKVKYSSGKKSVVTVKSNGVLTAKSKGSGIIEIRSGKKKIKVKVTVK